MAGEGPLGDRAYSWQDKLGQAHTVSTTLDLPGIESYELQHTVGGYKQITDLLDDIMDRAELIATVLNAVGIQAAVTAALYLIAFVINIITYIVYEIALNCVAYTCLAWAAWAILCVVLYTYVQIMALLQYWIAAMLTAIVALAGGSLSIY